jgi:hypothetical protein
MYLGMIIFGLVRFLSKKKVTKLKFKKKTEPKPVQTDQFRFSFLDKNRFKLIWLGFFCLDWFFSPFFSVWVRFGSVFLVSGL